MVRDKEDDCLFILIPMMKYIKYLLTFIFLLFGYVPLSFSYFQDKLYCTITKENVVISLENKKYYTCKIYIRYIETQMKKVYNDILLIQKYIDKKQDLWYWKPLKDEKVVFLNSLQNMRLNILSHMQTFEENLIETSKRYFLNSIFEYKKKLDASLKAFAPLQNTWKEKYVILLKDQLAVIEKIEQAKTFEELNTAMQRYVYLKQQLEWK